MPRSRRRSASRAWSSCCCCARRASTRCRCTSDVSMRPGKRRVWQRGAMTDRMSLVPSRRTARRCNCGATANTSSPPSRRDRRSCRGSRSRGRLSPRWSLVSADDGLGDSGGRRDDGGAAGDHRRVRVPGLGCDCATPRSGGGRSRRPGGGGRLRTARDAACAHAVARGRGDAHRRSRTARWSDSMSLSPLMSA